MTNLQYRQEKIQEKRKKTKFRDFVMEICSWYNVNLYKNTGIISRFPETPRSGLIYKASEYFSRYNDGPDFMDYNNDISFFDQFQSFFISSAKSATLDYGINQNSDFADTIYGAKNAYISISVGENSENVLYSNMIFSHCKNIFDSFQITSHCENIYSSKIVTHSYNIFYSKFIHNSQDIWFSTNLLGCNHCTFCSQLENQSYYIYNKSYTKEEYFELLPQVLSLKDKYESLYESLDNKTMDRVVEAVKGNAISFSKNIQDGYFLSRVSGGKNIFCGDGSPLSENIYDTVDIAKVDDSYAYMGVGQNSSHVYCGANAATCHNIYYSYFMDSCAFCLGCIGLKNKSYCILNKQYTKEEWYQKIDEIFQKMEDDGILGEFFPATMNPFYFNDTAAYLIDPSFTKEEVTKLGYLWRDEPIKVDIPEGAITVQSSELGQFEGWEEIPPTPFAEGGVVNGEKQWKLDETVCKRVIIDEHGDAYRIIPMELEFLQKHGLPLPRKHWLTRMKENFRIN